MKKHRWCAWDSNLGPQDGRRRWNHGAMAATPLIATSLSDLCCDPYILGLMRGVSRLGTDHLKKKTKAKIYFNDLAAAQRSTVRLPASYKILKASLYLMVFNWPIKLIKMQTTKSSAQKILDFSGNIILFFFEISVPVNWNIFEQCNNDLNFFLSPVCVLVF